MKHTYIYTIVSILVIIFCTANCTDENIIKPNTENELNYFSLQEAKDFFEKEAERNLILSRSYNNKAITPGDFILKWESAIGSSKSSLACYDIPIVPTFRYKAIYVDNKKRGGPSANKVNVYQKLLIVKDLNTKRMDQYILTLIPSKTCEDKCSQEICSNFVNCSDKGGFTGIAIYSHVYTNQTARVSLYENGIKTYGVFLLDATSETEFKIKYEFAKMLVSTIAVQKKNSLLTRGEDNYDYTYDGGWFDEVIVTPEPDYSDWGANDMEDWLNSSRPDTSPIDPEPEMEEPPVFDDYFNSNDDKDQKPVQSRDFIAAKDDKFVISKLPDRMEKQIGYTCVTSIISFIELTMGGNATYDDNGVLKTDHGSVLQEYIKYRQELDANISTGEILKDILGNGMNLENLSDFIDRFFATEPADNLTVSEAIDKGYIIMTAVASEMENSAHNVAIIGYHTNGELIYMDPEYGCWREAPASEFGLYAYVISGLK